MRHKKSVSFALVTHNRKEELKECLESILDQEYSPIEVTVVDNNSNDGTEELLRTRYSKPFIHYLKLPENKGTVRGRNISLQMSEGDIIVTLDDDSVLGDRYATKKIVEKFESDKDIGVLAFKIINYYPKKISLKYLPYRKKSLSPNQEFETTYFLGCGHAIKREVYETVGFYMDVFFGMEELDLSFRILEAEKKIIFFPEVKVYHKKSKKGRVPNELEHMLQNRFKVLYRNLPWKYVVVNSLFWTVVILVKTGSPLTIYRAAKQFFQDFPDIKNQRKVLRSETLKRIKKLKGRLYY